MFFCYTQHMKNLKAFTIRKDNKLYDYRLGAEINLKEAADFFKKKYHVQKIWSGARHVLGYLDKNGKRYFLKLATSKGISLLTENEYAWNEKYNQEVKRANSLFWVPQNYDSGFFQNNLFYLITDRLEGEMLANLTVKQKISDALIRNITNIIDFTEQIQNLKNINLNPHNVDSNNNHHDSFILKTKLWYQDIPKIIISKFEINKLLKVVVENAPKLSQKPRHGDFTPWHLMELKSGQLGLIDGEHFAIEGVENYDIAYLIQRVYSVLKTPILAKSIFSQLQKRKYNFVKLKIVLAARAIGGYLDESLSEYPDYNHALEFQKLVLDL